jgi:transcriptional regulator with XRE-family HTH domain
VAQDLTATEIAGRRLRELRSVRKLSAQALADRCAELGVTSLKRQVITNIENGRRGFVGIDELLALAWALDAPPVMFMLPIGRDERLRVTPSSSLNAAIALPWVAGEMPAAAGDRQRRLAWQAVIGPVSTYRAIRTAYDAAGRAELAGEGALIGALRELGRETDLLIEHDLDPIPLPADWLMLMKREGFLKYPDDVPVRVEEVGGDDR